MGHDVAEGFRRPHHVVGAQVERRDSEPHDVRGPEVADDAPVDERLHGRIGVLESERYLGTAIFGRSGADKFEPRTALLHLRDEPVAKCHRAGANVVDRRFVPYIQRRIQGGERDDRRRAHPHPFDTRARAIVEVERERGLVAQPAREGGAHPVDVFGRDVDECRRTRTRVQELVGAADGEVGPGAGKIDGQRSRRVGQIPDRQCAGRVRRLRQARHVVPATGAVVDLGQQQHCDVLVERLADGLRSHGPDLVPAPERANQPVGHVEVGREVAVIRQDDATLRPHPQGGGHRLVDLDGQRVAHHHGAGRRADQPADAIADPGRLLHPARVIPAADQHLAPFRGEQTGHTFTGGKRQGAERVAVEVDDALGQMKEGSGSVEVGHRHTPSCVLVSNRPGSDTSSSSRSALHRS